MRILRAFLIAAGLGGITVAAYGGFIWSVYFKGQNDGYVPKDAAYRAKQDVRTTDLGGGFYMLQGHGGNITVSVGTDGILLVDTDEDFMASAIQKAVAALGDADAVIYIINTHSHGDHRGGNGIFQATGAKIIAHAATRANMETDKYAPASDADLPTIIVGDGHEMTFNGQTISLFHPPLAHTNGDFVVRFLPANIIATGDVFVSNGLPFLSLGAGATLDGHLDGQDMILGLADTGSILVPGHGELSDRDGLREIRGRLGQIRSYMGWLKDRGLSAKFLPLAHPVFAWPADMRGQYGWAKTWSRLVYSTLP